LVGAALYGATLSLGIWARSVWDLVVIVAFGGVGMSLFWLMAEAAIAEGATGRVLSRRMGIFNISWSVGDVAGMAVSGALYDVWGRLPFVMIVVVMAALVVVLAFARRAKVEEVPPPQNLDEREMLEVPRSVNARFTRAAWVGNFTGAGVMGVVRSLFAAPATDIFRMSGAVYGLAIGTVCVFRTLTFWLLTHWRNWHYRKGVYLATSSLLAAGMAGITVAAVMPHVPGMVLVFVSFAAAGVAMGMMYYSSLFYSVHTEALPESGTRLHEAVVGAGGTAAVLASGGVGQLVRNASGAFATLGAFALVSPFALCAVTAAAGVVTSWCFITGRLGGKDMLEETAPACYPDRGVQAPKS
ncbi:MAG: MFS transporter, partial [Planctomycetes bacterium]|nr:MFS transporter [Planctomycetota bacterium]